MIPTARLVFGLSAVACFSGELSAQPCSAFDVASIKVNTSGAGGGYPDLAPGARRFTATNQLMVELIMSAYDVSPLQISGIPKTFFHERYDIDATCEQPVTKEQIPYLLQALLAERFQLSVHQELREQPVYALVVGKGGPRLHKAAHEAGKPGLRQNGHTFTFTNAEMANLTGVLSQLTGRKVVDRTELRGKYDFTLSYAPNRSDSDRDGSNVSTTDNSLPDSVFTAVREQLGLNFETRKSQVEFIVVDHLGSLNPN